MTIRKTLLDCYNTQASHFHHTRKKHRPELDHIVAHLGEPSPDTKLIDLGCGTGRTYPFFRDHRHDTLDFIGVDISSGMITKAQDEYPEATFVTQDMLTYLRSIEQQSLSHIISVAAIQHLPTPAERLNCFKLIYRALSYGGTCIVTNRAFSKWFLHKYRKTLLSGLIPNTLSPIRKFNDVFIPRRDPNYTQNQKEYLRYYHIFTLRELRRLATQA